MGEAQSLLKSLNASYDQYQVKIKGAVDEFAAELMLNPDKAAKLADKVLHLIADMQQDNVKHAKHLLEHIVKSGKRSETLEKHVDKQLRREVKAEKQLMEDDGVAPEHEDADEEEPDPLKHLLEGFWATFDDYESEFNGKVRANLKNGHPLQTQLQDLYKKIQSEEALSEEEAAAELDKMDLASIGAGLGSGRVLPVFDIIEEMALITVIPHDELQVLKDEWFKGKQDSVSIVSILKEMHAKGLIPSGWLQMGVDAEEKSEEDVEGRGGADDDEK